MALKLVVKNENDAWEILSKLDKGEIDIDQPIDLKFDGWPSIDLHYSGQDFDQSVPTRIMPALLDAQKELHRLFCQLRYGEQNLKKLTHNDRERLELVVKVDGGSSNLETNLSDTLNEIFKGALSNMESKDILYAILGAGLLWASGSAWKNYLNSKAEEKKIDSKIELSKLENERLNIVTDISKRQPYMKAISDGVDDFRNHSLHKLKKSDELSIPNTSIKIDGRHASEITHTPRAESKEVRIDGEFIILSVISGSTKGFKLKVKNIHDGSRLNVSVPKGTLNNKQRKILRNNEWAKKPVYLSLNARELRGEITTATLVKATEIEKQK